MFAADPFPDGCNPLFTNATVGEQRREVLAPQRGLSALAPLFDSGVKDTTGVQLRATKDVDLDVDAFSPKDIDHPHRIEIYERVSGVEQDRADQKNTGSLYEPNTSSMAARISKSVQYVRAHSRM